MELHNYGRGVLHVVCPEPEELAYAFLRIQESSSNPNWVRRKSFTQEEFLDKYAELQRQDKRWDYHEEYVGFSAESRALIPFYKGRFNPLSTRESRLLRLLAKPTDKGNKRAFVIGSTEGDTDTMRHELSRALSYVDSSYNDKTLKVIRQIPAELKLQMREWFINDGGFLPRVINPEIVAEFADWDDSYMCKEQHLDRRTRVMRDIHAQIRGLYDKAVKTLNLRV